MKVLIPFSGGVNSTYCLWRWLAETDHEIHAYRHTESFESEVRKQVSARKMIQWLKDNVRDFTFWEEEEVLPSHPEVLFPVRKDFTNTWNIGTLIPRWKSQAELLDRIKPDALVKGVSLETAGYGYLPVRHAETRSSLYDRDVKFYFAGNKTLDTPIDFMNPSDPDEWVEKVFYPMTENWIGRYEQWEAIPQSLKDLYEKPHDPIHENYSELLCRDCLFEKVQELRTDLTGREKDLELARFSQHGPYWAEANSETYRPSSIINNSLVKMLKDHIAFSYDPYVDLE
tara:strand:- start:1036 stop:1890 length:855 start_codon:yes stop_codon:yes gene_type:complete